MSDTKLHELKTTGGHPLDQAASALQKSIRRGLEEDALYWAQELESRFPLFLWKRLIIIAHEDVGIATPEVIPFVGACKDQYYWLLENKKHCTLPLVNAVMYMCRALKTRRADHWHSIIYLTDMRKEIPDYAIDKHTEIGREMGRGTEDFYENGAVIIPAADALEDLLVRAQAIDRAKKPRSWLGALRGRMMGKKNGKAAATAEVVDETEGQMSMFF